MDTIIATTLFSLENRVDLMRWKSKRIINFAAVAQIYKRKPWIMNAHQLNDEEFKFCHL